MDKNSVELIGFAAAACTTFSFIPQIVKIRRQGGKDLSYPMLTMYLVGLLLWLAYGLFTKSLAVIAANAVSSLLVLVAIVAKLTYRAPTVISQEKLCKMEQLPHERDVRALAEVR